MNTLKIKNSKEEILLGLGLGLGYATSFRLIGPIGISELLILSVIVLLFKKYYKRLFIFTFDFKGFIKGYLFLSLFIISPLMTFAYFNFSDLNSTPIYLISSIMGWLLCFLIVEATKNGFDISKVTLYFAILFISTNLITILFFPSLNENTVRYQGAASNPNQLLFYASSLSLLLLIYQKKLAFFAIPAITFIMLKTGSDAYMLTLFISVFSYLFLLFYNNKISFGMNIFILIFILSGIIIVLIINYETQIIDIWLMADEGNVRVALILNAIAVSLSSPVFGYGVGSYSGIAYPFENSEAHNTFLDFSMQFGIPFSLIVYFILFMYFFKTLKSKDFMVSSFVLAFVVSGLFHFTGRHFNFWVEIAVFYGYIFHNNQKENRMKCAE